MHNAQEKVILGMPKRKDTPANLVNDSKKLQDKVREVMEIPEIIIESRDSDVDSGIKDGDDSSVHTPTTSTTSSSNHGSPRFIVDPVSSRKNSEEQKFRFQKSQTEKRQSADASVDNLESASQCSENTKEPNSSTNAGLVSANDELRKETIQTKETAGTSSNRKISDTQSSDGQPKSRKVSFLENSQGLGHPQFYLPDNAQHGFLYIPSPAHSRKVSAESFYGQHPSRKTSLNAFYYPGYGGLPGLPHHKISVFSMQSVDSDRTFTDTHEVLPHEDHYRDLMNVFDLPRRPTLFELREEEKVCKSSRYAWFLLLTNKTKMLD